MATEKKKPTRRSVKGAKRVGSSTVINTVATSPVSESANKPEEPIDHVLDVQIEEEQPDEILVTQSDEIVAIKEVPSVQKPIVKIAKQRPAKTKREKANIKKTFTIVLKTFLVVAVLFFVGTVGVFSWDRWLRYDDAADFRGQWIYTDGSAEVTIFIDKDTMRIADEVDYDYEIDSWAKTVTFTFFDLEGGAKYRFSKDRSTIIICENAEATDWLTEIQLALNLIDITVGFDPDATIYLKHV